MPSQSTLKHFAKSPAHVRHYLDRSESQTESQLIGSAVHAALLEPDVFASQWGTLPDGLNLRTKADRATRDELVSYYDGKLLNSYQMSRVMKSVESVRGCTSAMRYLEGPKELTAVFEHEGVKLKARLDCFIEKYNVVVDIKTTKDASRAFEKDLWKYNYPFQGAFYCEAMRANRLNASQFLIIAVETEAPFGAQCFLIDEKILVGMQPKVSDYVKRWQYCTQTNNWQGYDDVIQHVACPDWLKPKVNV
jgi:hypothetical protein